MTRIHIERIKEEGLVLEFEERPESFPVLAEMIQKGECEFVAPVRTALRAIRIDDMVEVEGNIDTSVRLTCGRCLKEFEIPLKTPFALTFAHQGAGTKENYDRDNVELSAEDMGLIYFQGEEINLQDGIQEYVVMTFPLRALCMETCRGLCPGCGADLNDGDCGCDRMVSNSKFAVLTNLKLNRQ